MKVTFLSPYKQTSSMFCLAMDCLIIAITLKNMNTLTNVVVFVEISTTIMYTNAEYVYIFK